MANISDKLTETTNGTRPVPGKLTALRASGAGAISVDALTGWPTNTAVHFIIYSVDTAGKKIAGSQTDWKGIVTSPTSIGSLTLKAGTDNGDSVGAIVEAAPTAAWADDLVEALAFDHEQSNGGHKTLHDANGNEWLERGAVASAVNQVKVTNAITGVAPTVEAAGDDTNIDLSLKPKGTGVVKVDGSVPRSFFALYNFIESGCIWSSDAPGSTRAASMTAGVVWIGGKRLTVAAVTARLFTASKDTYVDFQDNGDGTATVIYTEVTNNTISPALPNSKTDADNVRNGIIVTGASNIANAASINQGQEDRVLPIVTSVPYSVSDGLGYLVCPRDPNRRTLGYRQMVANATGLTGLGQVAGMSVPIRMPNELVGRKIRVEVFAYAVDNSTSTATSYLGIWEGVVSSGTRRGLGSKKEAAANSGGGMGVCAEWTPAAASFTVNLAFDLTGGTGGVYAGATNPTYMRVELV